jgi:hypothetical protein
VTQPLKAGVAGPIREHGRVLILVLALASVLVFVSAPTLPERLFVGIGIVAATALMIPAGLVALITRAPERAAANELTPGEARAFMAMWASQLPLGAVMILLAVSPDVREFVGSLPAWAETGLGLLLAVDAALWLGFGSVVLGEAWYGVRKRLGLLGDGT